MMEMEHNAESVWIEDLYDLSFFSYWNFPYYLLQCEMP